MIGKIRRTNDEACIPPVEPNTGRHHTHRNITDGATIWDVPITVVRFGFLNPIDQIILS